MERRRLQGAMNGLSQGLQQIGLNHAMDTFKGSMQAAPMTGTGIKAGNVPPQTTPDDKGDAAAVGGSADDNAVQPGQDYVIPARPSTLMRESGEGPGMQLMRRRLDPSGYGRRRLG